MIAALLVAATGSCDAGGVCEGHVRSVTANVRVVAAVDFGSEAVPRETPEPQRLGNWCSDRPPTLKWIAAMGRGTAEADVRGMTNLYKAFAIVRSNVNASGRKEFKAQVKQISEDPLPYLRRIQTQLKNGSFVFDKQHGVLKKKPTGKTGAPSSYPR